jgi:cytochrome P450
MRALFGFDPRLRYHRVAQDFERALGFWGRDYLAQMLRGPGSPWRSMTRARARLDRLIFDEIARRRRSGERGLDLLSLLLDAEDEAGGQLSGRELRDQVMTLLFAGHDTTTSTVSFLFYELAHNPRELDALVYDPARLEMAIDETLRMYPPAWVGPRRSLEAFELCGVRVPGDVLVNYSSWASHRLPHVFPEPDRFRPERFAPDAKGALPKGAYIPFGGGSRTCIGMRFGQSEVRTIAAEIVRRFRLELAEPQRPLAIRQMPTISPRGGLPVVVRAI